MSAVNKPKIDLLQYLDAPTIKSAEALLSFFLDYAIYLPIGNRRISIGRSLLASSNKILSNRKDIIIIEGNDTQHYFEELVAWAKAFPEDSKETEVRIHNLLDKVNFSANFRGSCIGHNVSILSVSNINTAEEVIMEYIESIKIVGLINSSFLPKDLLKLIERILPNIPIIYLE